MSTISILAPMRLDLRWDLKSLKTEDYGNTCAPYNCIVI